MEEVWKDIKGYEGLYKISNFGNVYSLNIKRNKTLSMSRNGYLYVDLLKNQVRKHFYVHRLVAEAFIENTNKLPVVNHKDECKTNNCVDNLEWCSYVYNNNYGTHIKRCILTKIKNNCINAPKKIDQYSLDGKFIKTWNSGTDITKNGFNRPNICKCCNGLRKTSKGYIWKYHE